MILILCTILGITILHVKDNSVIDCFLKDATDVSCQQRKLLSDTWNKHGAKMGSNC